MYDLSFIGGHSPHHPLGRSLGQGYGERIRQVLNSGKMILGTLSEARYVDVDTHFCFHFANGFESDGKLVVDMAWDSSQSRLNGAFLVI